MEEIPTFTIAFSMPSTSSPTFTPPANILPAMMTRDILNNLTNSTSQTNPSWQPTTRSWVIFQGTARIGMGFLAGALLVICSLLAGLILGVCGLDERMLRMRYVVGCARERKRARCVARMKRHSSWMLCSLIILSVACGEAFPFVIQTIFSIRQIWIPILISTLSIAIFAEILPQYLIPRHAIAWGYFCCPLIWGSMFLTMPISWPLAWALDRICGRKGEREVFSHEELGGLVRWHERGERNGGSVSGDAARVVVGALKLDSLPIGGEIKGVEQEDTTDKDVEKEGEGTNDGLITKWDVVKSINIDELVDEAFVKKVKGWSYSRLPVIGRPPNCGVGGEEVNGPTAWNGTQVFGFLHVKNLIGLDLTAGLLVKDLPLYPMPIVREDMSAYDLLKMFQLGVSRTAVVIPRPRRESSFCALQFTTNHSLHGFADFKTTLWTATQRTNARIISKLKSGSSSNPSDPEKGEIFSQDSLETVTSDDLETGNGRNNKERKSCVVGIRTPKPRGIVTWEDIVDALVMKNSRDEKDFYEGRGDTKGRKIGDREGEGRGKEVRFGMGYGDMKEGKEPVKCDVRKASHGSLRQRKVSKEKKVKTKGLGVTLDGVDEHSLDSNNDTTSDSYPNRDTKIIKNKNSRDYNISSYTTRSGGGFHHDSGSTMETGVGEGCCLTQEDIKELCSTSSSSCKGNPYSDVVGFGGGMSGNGLVGGVNGGIGGNGGGVSSLPNRKIEGGGMWGPYGLKHQVRRFSDMPVLSLASVGSLLGMEGFEEQVTVASQSQHRNREQEFVMPRPSMDSNFASEVEQVKKRFPSMSLEFRRDLEGREEDYPKPLQVLNVASYRRELRDSTDWTGDTCSLAGEIEGEVGEWCNEDDGKGEVESERQKGRKLNPLAPSFGRSITGPYRGTQVWDQVQERSQNQSATQHPQQKNSSSPTTKTKDLSPKKSYDGFPKHLLENGGNKKGLGMVLSKTMPRLTLSEEIGFVSDGLSDEFDEEELIVVREKEGSFERGDERRGLASQVKGRSERGEMGTGEWVSGVGMGGMGNMARRSSAAL